MWQWRSGRSCIATTIPHSLNQVVKNHTSAVIFSPVVTVGTIVTVAMLSTYSIVCGMVQVKAVPCF